MIARYSCLVYDQPVISFDIVLVCRVCCFENVLTKRVVGLHPHITGHFSSPGHKYPLTFESKSCVLVCSTPCFARDSWGVYPPLMSNDLIATDLSVDLQLRWLQYDLVHVHVL